MILFPGNCCMYIVVEKVRLLIRMLASHHNYHVWHSECTLIGIVSVPKYD